MGTATRNSSTQCASYDNSTLAIRRGRSVRVSGFVLGRGCGSGMDSGGGLGMSDENSSGPTPQDSVPPGIYREYTFQDGEITCLAKLAQYVPGNPGHLFTFFAKEVTVGDTEINPPRTHPEHSRYSELGAFAVRDPQTIVYFFETWGEPARHRIEASLAALEIHELTHLFVPKGDNQRDEGHWVRWNELLIEEVGWVMEIDDWGPIDLTPASAEQSDIQRGRQATLTEVD